MTGLIQEAVETAADVAAPEAAIPAKIGAWLLGDVWRFAAIGALAATGVQQARIEGLYLRPHIGPVGLTLIDVQGWRPRAMAAEKALVDRKKAEVQARAAQVAENHKPAAISAALAEETNAHAPQNAARVDAAVAAYARAHAMSGGVRPAIGPSGVAGAACPGRSDPPAQGGDGQDVSSDMVALPRADLDGFAANTRDLDAIRAYLAGLIAKGVAVPDASSTDDKPK